AAAEKVRVVSLAAPSIAVLEPNAAASKLRETLRQAHAERPTALLLTDVDTLLPATQPPPVATVVLDELRAALARPGLALIATTAHPEACDSRLRGADLLDRELTIPLADAKTRTGLL